MFFRTCTKQDFNNQLEGSQLTTTTKETSQTDSRTRDFFARIIKPFDRFRGFVGTPLGQASTLMSTDQIHKIEAVRLYFHHPEGFLENEHLMRVPYTERELRWASKNGFVLTIVSASMKQIAKIAGKDVMIANEVSVNPHIVGISPKHPQWRLVSRLGHRPIETKTLGLSDAELKRRLGLAQAPLALTMAYLDYAIHRKMSQDGLYLTATSLGEHQGDFARRILVGGSRRPDFPSAINVVTGRRDGAFSPILTLKPRKIPQI